ncbi:MAG: hypothetical protein FJ319_11050 [SAR202 cluster bacterium]|nr:hypothetical protein [SAR202 cluster bacterium]
MKIIDIQLIKIHPPLAKRYENKKVQLQGIDHRVIARVKTDNGIVGYGDIRTKANWTPLPQSFIDRLIDRSPFDFMNNTLMPALGGAMYDVMGKYLGVPAYKLMGQKVRDGVTVAAWCTQMSARDFAEQVSNAANNGYMVFKMHTADLYDPFEQAQAAADVAPRGFKVHFDFNGSDRSLGTTISVVAELEKKHPIVGFIEDPLSLTALGDWVTLRQRTTIPLIMHVSRLGGMQEAMMGAADIFMLGDGHPDYSVGDVLARGTAYSRANIQTVMQFTGGTLTKALALHMAAVLPSATGHSINLDDQYEDDVTTKRIPVMEGFSPVPEGPGLGFDVDEAKLAKFAAAKPIPMPRHVTVVHLPGGRKVYNAYHRPTMRQIAGREEGTVRGIDYTIWEDDGTAEFKRVYEKLRTVGRFIE